MKLTLQLDTSKALAALRKFKDEANAVLDGIATRVQHVHVQTLTWDTPRLRNPLTGAETRTIGQRDWDQFVDRAAGVIATSLVDRFAVKGALMAGGKAPSAKARAAFRLRDNGFTYREIGEMLLVSKQHAHRLVREVEEATQ